MPDARETFEEAKRLLAEGDAEGLAALASRNVEERAERAAHKPAQPGEREACLDCGGFPEGDWAAHRPDCPAAQPERVSGDRTWNEPAASPAQPESEHPQPREWTLHVCPNCGATELDDAYPHDGSDWCFGCGTDARFRAVLVTPADSPKRCSCYPDPADHDEDCSAPADSGGMKRLDRYIKLYTQANSRAEAAEQKVAEKERERALLDERVGDLSEELVEAGGRVAELESIIALPVHDRLAILTRRAEAAEATATSLREVLRELTEAVEAQSAAIRKRGSASVVDPHIAAPVLDAEAKARAVLSQPTTGQDEGSQERSEI